MSQDDDGFGATYDVDDNDGTSTPTPAATPGREVDHDHDHDDHNDPPAHNVTTGHFSRQSTSNGMASSSASGPDTRSSVGGGMLSGGSTSNLQACISVDGPDAPVSHPHALKRHGTGGHHNKSNGSGIFSNDLSVSAATALPSIPSAGYLNPRGDDTQHRNPSVSLLSVDTGFGQQVASSANSPAFGGSAVSFRSSVGGGGGGGGRRSLGGSALSNVSGIFVAGGGNDDDDDDNQSLRSGGLGRHGSGASPLTAKDANKTKTKTLPQQEQNDDDLAEELDAELLHVAEEQALCCNLAKLKIQRVPQELRTFCWLKELLLGENKIALLPDTIFANMQGLEVLDLMENRLTTVPRSCFQLRSLRRLLLDHNNIYCIPDEIDPDPRERFELPELLEIGLDWNNLQRFPTNLLRYAPNVEKMFLSENPGISQLPPPAALEPRRQAMLHSSRTGAPKKLLLVRLDNRPMLMQAAASNPVYQGKDNEAEAVMSLEWNKIYPDRVLDFLYLGSMRTAQCVEVYNDLDIGYVLTAARNLEVVLGPGMKHLTLPFDDLPGEDISHFFDVSFKFIEEAVSAKRGILIHCFAGASRSVAMTMMYLMRKHRISADDALALIKQRRPAAHPNEGFVARLRRYTEELGITAEASAKVRLELEKTNRD
jgi:protein-tyrosine phosphatase